MNYLKSLLLAAMAVATVQLSAAPVSVDAAQTKAKTFLTSQVATGRLMLSSTNLTLAHTQTSAVDATAADFYVFNTASQDGFVIVAGDDRVEDVLAYGDKPFPSVIPSNVQSLLDMYTRQMEVLLADPSIQVQSATTLNSSVRKATTVAQLMSCTWNQEAPFYNQCPSYNSSKCLTGCVATAMAQVMYYWKFPATAPAISAYTTETNKISVSALSGMDFDWDNMLDSYSGSYTTTQGNAVAWLMRYCGQAASMDYDTEGSGAYCEDQLTAMQLFGYYSGSKCLDRDDYSSTDWEALMQEDLEAGRPILYAGDDRSAGGHAFVVDGYNASTSKYHVNFGWSGECDGYYALDAFKADSYTFKYYQQMLYNIYPEGQEETLETYAPVMLEADANYITSTSFKAEWTDETPSENVSSYTLYVNAYDPSANQTLLTETFSGVEATSDGSTNVASSLDTYCDNSGWTGAYVYLTSGGLKLGSSKYAGYITSPELDMSDCGGTITVKFNAAYYNTDASSITVSCGDASETVALTSSAADYTVVLTGVTEAAGQTVTLSCTAKKQRLYIYSVEVITGDASSSASLMASETGDASYRVITGITDKSYVVENLTPGATYKFYVVANYTDGTTKQSNVETVTLLTESEPFVTYAPVMLEPDSAYITTTSFRADWTDETPEDNVTDYTLYVNVVESGDDPDPDPDPDPEVTVTTLLTETFSGVEATSDGTSDISSSLDTYCDISGWTGYAAYLAAGGLKMGASSKKGYLTSPELDLSDCGGTITVTINAASWVNSSGTSDGTSVVISCGDVSETVELTDEAADYTVVLTGVTAEAGQTVTISASAASKQRYYLYSVTIYSGDATSASLNAARKAVSETGDATYRIITGITDKYYVVENLTPGATYEYYVVANYTNGTTAESNHQTVTLLTESDHGYPLGDVNHDGIVNVDDVAALIAMILGNGEGCDICADVNGDETVNVDDVAALIAMILGN